MLSIADSADPLLDLERRQDEVLQRLDELDRRVEQAIREFVAVQKDTTERFAPKQKAAA